MDISRYKNVSGQNTPTSRGVDEFGQPLLPTRKLITPIRRDYLSSAMHVTSSVATPQITQQEEPIPVTPPPLPVAAPLPPVAPPPARHVYPKYVEPVHPLRPVKHRHPIRSWSLRFAALFIVVLLGTGGFLSWKGYNKLHKVFRGTTTVAALASDNVDPNLLDGEGDGRVNILLLGIGGAGHDGADLTDTMLIMSVDPVNHTAALLSVPRDLWVKMPNPSMFGANQKINAAYETGKYGVLGRVDASNSNQKALQAGFAADDLVLKQVLGIKINYHVLVDFQAFRQAIDTVGGVTVDVKDQLFDPTMAWENNNNPVLAPAGLQVMDGKKALMYSRSRETSSDFARTERQRQILLALKDKVLSAGTLSNPAKIDSLMNAFGDNVYSDLSTKGAQRLYTIIKQIPNGKIQSIGLAQPPNMLVTTDHVGTISVVRPVAGFDNYDAIQTFVRSQLKDGFLTRENAPIVVINGSTTPEQTQSVANELKSYGYNIIDTITNPAGVNSVNTTVVDMSKGSEPYTLRYLTERYGDPQHALPASIQMEPGTVKFVILVGQK